MGEPLASVNHDYLRYGNCWEDADLLLKALEVNETSRILSIASAGDNSFSLLSQSPEMLIAVDVNQVQLHLVALKVAAFKVFSHQDFLRFLGFSSIDKQKRRQLFLQLKPHLDITVFQFWEQNSFIIEKGIIHQGKFEKYLRFFAKRILPFIHSRKKIVALFNPKTEKDQQEFFQKKWNTLLWRTIISIFFSKWVMGKFGRDPKFLKEVNQPVSTFVKQQIQQHLSSQACQNNPYLHYMLFGFFNVDRLPHYARQENFESIKANLNKLVLFKGYAQNATDKFSSLNRYNLSNIFEYMDNETFLDVSQKLMASAESYSLFAYWNLMVPRQMNQLGLGCSEVESINEIKIQDAGFFYHKFTLDKMNK